MNEYLVSVLYEYMGEYLIGKHTLYGDTAKEVVLKADGMLRANELCVIDIEEVNIL